MLLSQSNKILTWFKIYINTAGRSSHPSFTFKKHERTKSRDSKWLTQSHKDAGVSDWHFDLLSVTLFTIWFYHHSFFLFWYLQNKGKHISYKIYLNNMPFCYTFTSRMRLLSEHWCLLVFDVAYGCVCSG